MPSFKKYFHVLRIAFLDALEYRTELFIRVLGWGLRLIISLFLWYAVMRSSGGKIGDYPFESMVIYFFFVQMMASFIFNDSGFAINRDIQYGDFSNYLTKPIRYLPFRFFSEFSYNIARSILGIILFGSILIFIKPELFSFLFENPERLILFLAASFLAMLINFHLIATIASLSFWIVTAHRLLFIYFGIINIFSGLILPIDLFPEKAAAILRFFPFPYLFFFPLQIILKPINPQHFALTVLLPQLIQLLFLSLLLTFIFSRGLKHYEAVGR